MTINGGKPHAVGDRGQRYEVTFLDESGVRKVLGWCTTTEAAETYCKAVRAHPAWTDPVIIDRHAAKHE